MERQRNRCLYQSLVVQTSLPKLPIAHPTQIQHNQKYRFTQGRFWGIPQDWTLNDLYPTLNAHLIYTPFFFYLNFKRQNYPCCSLRVFSGSFFWKLKAFNNGVLGTPFVPNMLLAGTLHRRKSRRRLSIEKYFSPPVRFRALLWRSNFALFPVGTIARLLSIS